MKKRIFLVCSTLCLLHLTACRQATSPNNGSPESLSSTAIQKETEKANRFFDQVFDNIVADKPMQQTMLGIKKDYHLLNDFSHKAFEKDSLRAVQTLAYLRDSLSYEALDQQAKVSFQLMKTQMEDVLASAPYFDYEYLVNQMHGYQAELVSFLINMHKIESVSDAEAYLARMEAILPALNQIIQRLQIAEKKGVVPPKFVFDYVLDDAKNILSGYPLVAAKQPLNVLYDDFKKKIEKIPNLSEEFKKQLLGGCEKRLHTHVKPAYEKLIAFVSDQKNRATADAGVWKFPNGDKYYQYALQHTTTTNLTADEIHQMGLNEVARIHEEMTKLMQKIGFKSNKLQEFFTFMRTDKQFYYANTPDGKKQYLQKATAIIDSMRTELPKLFNVMPKAAIDVKQVEEFREKSAGKAFYEDPAPDGSRPGRYYVNLYNMASMPNYQMEALAYHEGIPGHHMQIAIAQEMDKLPKFRRFGSSFTAYIEGWGLYSEFIPKEIGYYKDPYSDFGRLAMELWRACRLVVDTGIHSKQWTREQAIEFYRSNTPNPEADCINMVERHIVMPGQATAYKVGMIKILELRKKAQDALKERFDLRKFHDVVLTNGAVSLNVLEALVDEYIAANK
jgi:uncharacterized protein (DUF885 family)